MLEWLFSQIRFESVKEVQYFCGKLSFDLIYELQRWTFLDAAHKLRDRFSCLYNLQSHTVSELKLKFGNTYYRQNEATRSRLLWPSVRIMCIFWTFCIIVLYSFVSSVRYCRFLLFLLVSILYLYLYLCSAWVANKHLIMDLPHWVLSWHTDTANESNSEKTGIFDF